MNSDCAAMFSGMTGMSPVHWEIKIGENGPALQCRVRGDIPATAMKLFRFCVGKSQDDSLAEFNW